MNRFGNWRPMAEMFAIAFLAAAVYVLALRFFSVDTSAFVYRPLALYLYFFVASEVIVTILILVEKKNKDVVGNTFLILTSVKMLYAYFLLRPVLAGGLRSEKINFFVLFALFLAIETIVSSRMLNRK